MLVIAGLGNPGRDYAGTRHNIGFDVVDELARRANVRFTDLAREAVGAEIATPFGPMLVLKPLTFMNASGVAVSALLQERGLLPEALLAVYDDFQIPLGTLRLRPRGSDGGHNGMASLIAELGTTEIPRLRCGIGSAAMPVDKSRMADFVLSPFGPDEGPAADAMVVRAADVCHALLELGMAATMNRYNGDPSPGSADEPASSVS